MTNDSPLVWINCYFYGFYLPRDKLNHFAVAPPTQSLKHDANPKPNTHLKPNTRLKTNTLSRCKTFLRNIDSMDSMNSGETSGASNESTPELRSCNDAYVESIAIVLHGTGKSKLMM